MDALEMIQEQLLHLENGGSLSVDDQKDFLLDLQDAVSEMQALIALLRSSSTPIAAMQELNRETARRIYG
jgi:hypothetical protein